MNFTIAQIKVLREAEDKVEFKEASHNYPFAGGSRKDQKARRKCFLGYIVALANEKGGHLILGVKEDKPHEVVGTDFGLDKIGALEDEIYERLKIRVHLYELFEDKKRLLVCKIPSRPIGRTLKFEGIPLMRAGDSLRNMSDDELYSILSEVEPDFTATIVSKLTFDDLDPDAISQLKKAYARKQQNQQFLLLDDKQALRDVHIIHGDEITYAALILLGREDAINKYLPQAQLRLEYRKSPDQIIFDQRYEFQGAFYNWINRLWDTINLRNGSVPVQEGSYIFDVPYFNEEVIREAINNMVAHRDYRMQSECVVKQSETAMSLINPGGFPRGVTIENVISVSSTPRNRLLADVLQKTGIVERSGQGVDKIYYQTLKEGKRKPDYSQSDGYQVHLDLSALIEDKAFALFIKSVQDANETDDRLSVFDVLCLKNIKNQTEDYVPNKNSLKKLVEKGLLVQKGRTKGTYYELCRDYYEFTDQRGIFSRTDWGDSQAVPLLINYLQKYDSGKTKDFIDLFEGRLTRKQVRAVLEKQLDLGTLERHGRGRGTHYTLSPNYGELMKVIPKALEIGLKQYYENEKNNKDSEDE